MDNHLGLDLPRLGPLQIRISVHPRGVSTCIWSDLDSARSAIETQFGRLESRLQQLGIKSLKLSCQAGHPATPESADAGTSNIDFRA